MNATVVYLRRQPALIVAGYRPLSVSMTLTLLTNVIGSVSARLIQDLLDADDLEVWPAEPGDDVTHNSVTLNCG